MPGFDAGAVVEALDYDFTYFHKIDPEHYAILAHAKGTVPEPSDEMVQRLQKRMSEATADMIPDGVDPEDRVAMIKAMAAMPEDKFQKSEAGILDALAELTAGNPTREQLNILPFRVKRKFIQWLTKQLMDPEPSAVGTTP
jgi:uncharacterized protein YgbK (DUF1537 family)